MMKKKGCIEKLREIVADILDDDTIEISEDTVFKSLPGWESVAQMTMVAMVENEFGTRFTLEEIEQITVVDDVLTKVDSQWQE